MPVSRITKEDLRARLEGPDPASAPAIVDARLKYPYEHSTVKLPGAIRMAPDSVSTAALSKDRDVVVYDSDPDEITGSAVAAQLIRQGFKATVLKGGIAEWAGANFPIDTKPAPKPAPAPAKA
jgi:rhodanese-related sulfurtransferase